MRFFVMCKQAFCLLPYKVMCACCVQSVFCVYRSTTIVLERLNQFIFDVANVGRSLAFIGRDGFYKSRAIFYRTG